MSKDVTAPCQECGASVYPEHIESGKARYEGGKLLCPHCVVDAEKENENKKEKMSYASDDIDLSPISFDEPNPTDMSESKADLSESRIHGFSDDKFGTHGWDESKFKRKVDSSSPHAIRCRIFHSKLSDGAMTFMNNQINEWLDEQTEISIKFATSTIGIVEGKHAEPNIMLTLFY